MKDRILFRINIKNTVLITALAFLNAGLFYLAQQMKLPFWLDTIGTMAAAIQLGPLAGMLTGLCASFLEKLFWGNSFLYSIVAAVTGLTVGFLITNKRRQDHLTLVSVGLLTGVISALFSIPLNAISQQGSTGNLWGDALMAMMERTVSTPEVNTFASVAFVGVPDRVISVYAALLLLQLIAPLLQDRGGKHKKPAKAGAVMTALLLTLSALPAQRADAGGFAADYETVTYSSKEGIFNSAVNAVAQTEDGYLWVGTYSGLYLYDGVKFEDIRLHDSISTVKELLVDAKGRLWIGTNDRGVVCYDPADKSTAHYSTETGLSSDSIRAICEDTNGNIYVGTALSVSKITPEGSVKTYLEWRDILLVQSLAPLPDGGVIGVTNSGILFLIRDDLLLDTVECPDEGTGYRCAVRAEDTVYVGSGTSLIDKYRADGETLKRTGSLRLNDSKYCNRLRYDAASGGLFYCCELFKLADKALYVVKQNGKHGCSFYERGADANTDGGASKDLSQILQIIGERNEGKGAFSISFDKMQVVYRYLCRSAKNSGCAASILRFSLEGAEKVPDEATDSFEEQLIVGLKRNDVVSRYAGSFFVLLNGLTGSAAEQAAEKLIGTWQKPESAADITAVFESEQIGNGSQKKK